MPDCIFCKIIAGELPSYKVYEDSDVLAFLDIHPTNPGHTLVIPKQHHRDFLDTSADLQSKLIQAIGKLAPIIMKAVGAEAFNLFVNNGAVAGQIIFHTHFHIVPRFTTDGHKLWHGKDMTQEELVRIAGKIKEKL